MTDEPIRATSEQANTEDLRLRDVALDLIQRQNQAMVDLAKNMLTITFTAVAVVITVKASVHGGHAALTVAALVALLCSVPVYLAAVRGYRIRISAVDYQDVEAETGRLATIRNRLVNIGMALTGVAAILLTIAVT